MKNFLLILLGKGKGKGKGKSEIPDNGVFKSECYYDWIKLKNLPGSSEKFLEDMLVECYDTEIKERQEAFNSGVHTQQSIIAIPTDDSEGKETEKEYNNFGDRLSNTNIIFISFISIPSWSEDERKKICKDANVNANEQVRKIILNEMDQTSMRLFYTFDHNDFVILCDGEKTKFDDYMNVLAKIRAITLEGCRAVHDTTTIYGYKDNIKSQDKINAVFSISGQNIDFSSDTEKLRTFSMETIGRYDHLSGYNGITWEQLADMGSQLRSENVITSRVHIGCNKSEAIFHDYSRSSSSLFCDFEKRYTDKINKIEFDKLTELYKDDEDYVSSIRILLYEIGFAINTTLQRGFSKYNGVCYIESFLCFLDFIKEKTIEKFSMLSKPGVNDNNNKNKIKEEIRSLAESLVDISNSFYKSILTLDSSIMHSERRFIMSDPYQFALFDVPPKLIAYYTAVASKMAKILNVNSDNRYVFLITPDIKKDIYVESITRNTDIGNEVNILVIHINERSIYSITDTTRSIAHEIAHHVGQNTELRQNRATHFAKCYIAMLLVNSLDHKFFPDKDGIGQHLDFITNIVEEIYDLFYKSLYDELLNDKNKFYYMDKLQNNIHLTTINNLNENADIQNKLKETMLKKLSKKNIEDYIRIRGLSYIDTKKADVVHDPIVRKLLLNLIFNDISEQLNEYVSDTTQLNNDVKNIRFVFKEGYADTQMLLLLTNDSKLDKNKAVSDYSKALNHVINRADEIMRKCAVISACTGTADYKELWEAEAVQEYTNFYIAYLTFICIQASSYFSEVRNNTQGVNFDKMFNCSEGSLFKSGNIGQIINHMDSTIESYVEQMLRNDGTLKETLIS